MNRLISEVGYTAPLGRWSFVVLAIVGLVLLVAAAVMKLPPPEKDARRVLARVAAFLGIAGATFAIAGGVAYVQAAGRVLPPAHWPWLVALGDVVGRFALGVVLTLSVPAAALVATRASGARERLAAVVIAAPLVLAGVAITWDALLERAQVMDPNAGAGDREANAVRYAADLGVLGLASSAVPWIALLALVVALVATHRVRTSRKELALGAGVLLIGIAAFAATRRVAYDARHPLPHFQYRRLRADEGGADWGPLPAALRGQECFHDLENAPVLLLTRPTPTLGEDPVDATSLGPELETVKRNFAILHPGERFYGLIVIGRGVGEGVLPFETALRTAQSVGFDQYVRLGAKKRRVRTATRGDVVIDEICFQRFELGG